MNRNVILDGDGIGLEVTLLSRSKARIRIWDRTTDEVLHVDEAAIGSAKAREQATQPLAAEIQAEAGRLLLEAADRLFDQGPDIGPNPPDGPATVQPATPEDLLAHCRTLAEQPRILEQVADRLERSGVVGVRRLVKLLYLALTSRLFDKPVSIAIKGPSAGGKSFPVDQVLRLFPNRAFYTLTAFSERALAYGSEPLDHRALVLYEAAGMSGDMQSYLLRSLLSEGRVRYETVEKGEDGKLQSRVIERDGPTALITTTTKASLHPENETRLLSITVADTPEQTRAVLRAQATAPPRQEDTDPWLALQDWIAGGPVAVDVPFAGVLAERVSTAAVRVRRDFTTVLTLVRAHALLHQETRDRDRKGRVIATLADYAEVRALVGDLVAEGIEATVSPIIKETVHAVTTILADPSTGETVTAREVGLKLGLDKSAALRRVRTALHRGYLRNDETGRGRPAKLRLGDPLPEESEALPTPDQLRTGCTVARPSGGTPSVTESLAELSPNQREAYEERSAIHEYEGGLPRALADGMAFDAARLGA